MLLRRGQLPRRALRISRTSLHPRISSPPSLSLRSHSSSPAAQQALALQTSPPWQTSSRCFSTTPVPYKRTHHRELGPPAPEFDPDERATFTEIMTRRRYRGRLVAGTAAGMSSEGFKRPFLENIDKRGEAMSWDGHFSAEAKARHPCTLKAAAKQYLSQEGLISLGGGLPSQEYFPVEQMALFVHKDPFFHHLEGMPFTRTDPKTLGIPGGTYKKGKYKYKYGVGVGDVDGIRTETVQAQVKKRFVEKDQTKNGIEYDLTIASNYAQARGSPQMLRFVTEHAEVVHSPPYRDWGCAMTPGATAALEQSLRLLCDRGDGMITDEFAFSTALETARPIGINVAGVPMDEEGMIPKDLDSRLERWSEEKEGGNKKPKVLYTVPTGHNPTGGTMSKERREAIYKVAQKHDLIIIEDDPYYFLQFHDDFEPKDIIHRRKVELEESEYGDMLETAREGRENPEKFFGDDFDELSNEGDEAAGEELQEANVEDPGANPEPSKAGPTRKTRPQIGSEEWDYFKGKKQKGAIPVAEAVLYATRQAQSRKEATIRCPKSPQDDWVQTRLIPSFLNLDTDGRVIRLDSFSKTLIPGLRLGWITAPEAVVQKFVQHSEVCSQGPAGTSQLIAWKLVDSAGEGWGHDGYIDWVSGLAMQYQVRRNVMLGACELFLGFGADGKWTDKEENRLVRWTVPKGGMFDMVMLTAIKFVNKQLWLTIDHTKHPSQSTEDSILQLENDIFAKCTEMGALLGRGSWFIAQEGGKPSRLCFRATYAAASKDDMATAIHTFSSAVRAAWGLVDAKKSSLDDKESFGREMGGVAGEEEAGMKVLGELDGDGKDGGKEDLALLPEWMAPDGEVKKKGKKDVRKPLTKRQKVFQLKKNFTVY
ncbi:uncharacterized protein MKZ38_007159 [Zalerion maritima]|uniref:Aminotransferase class I/classII large domain-containing protein n=1 Tax=Zalerion maritima TaxID=339359 RepID=A0AAD5RX03_9PEZI|nr:uncharacterized protein MKZ38_007159 [Zalerion maritima]